MRGHYTQDLLKLQTRELVRNVSYFVFVAVFPFFMSGMFLGMTYIMAGKPGGPDFGPIVMPMAIFLAVTGIGLQVTAGPLAELREAGALRVLGTTPLSRTDFLLTHLAVRFIMGIIQIAIIIAIAIGLDLVTASNGVLVFAVSLIGLALFFTIGYLIGGVVSSGQLAANLSTLIQLLALFLRGAAIPFAILPDSLTAVLSKIPTSLFADLIFWAADSPLQRTSNPLLAFAVVIAVTVALFVVAVRTFKWDVRK